MAAAAILKHLKWPYLSNGLADQREIWHGDAPWPSRAFPALKFTHFQNQDGGGRHLEKYKIDHISATVSPIGATFGMVTHFDGLKPCHA